MTSSPSHTPHLEATASGGLRLSAAASLLGVLLLASIGVALVIDEGEVASAHILPTVIVQRVVTVSPFFATVVNEMGAEEPAASMGEAAPSALPANQPRRSVEERVAAPSADQGVGAPGNVAVEAPAEETPAELPQTMVDEPRRSGGGSSNPLGYDVWSPLLDGSLGIRDKEVADGEVARTPHTRRGLRPFSDANHG